MNGWLIGLIVIIILLICYLIFGYVFYVLMKKKSKIVDAELTELNTYEVEKGQRVLDVIARLTEHGYKFDKDAFEIISNGVNNISSLNMDQRSKYKNILDFMMVYLNKIYKEDKKNGKYILENEAVEFAKSRKNENDIYKKYNKAATIYNIYLQMIFTRTFLFFKREKYVSAIIF